MWVGGYAAQSFCLDFLSRLDHFRYDWSQWLFFGFLCVSLWHLYLTSQKAFTRHTLVAAVLYDSLFKMVVASLYSLLVYKVCWHPSVWIVLIFIASLNMCEQIQLAEITDNI